MEGLFIALVILGLAAGIIGPIILHQIEIDKRLDAGSSYNYEKMNCNIENVK